MSLPTLTTLPTELREVILGQLDSFPDLLAAILSCRSLHEVFKNRKSGICTWVMLNHLDCYDIRPEALSVWRASHISYPISDAQFGQLFKANLTKRRNDMALLLTLEDVKAILRLHSIVASVSSRYFASTIPALPLEESKFPSTPTERARMSRTFYRFELFCRLFKESRDADPAVISCWMQQFLEVSAAWEIEQLCCIGEFLFRQIAPIFNEIAAHDVVWGEFAVEPATWLGNPDVQGILMRGLEVIHRIITADDYKSKLQALTGGDVPQQRRSKTLYTALQTLYQIEDDRIVSTNTYQDYAAMIQPLSFDDSDCGPLETWKWVQEGKTTREALAQTSYSSLRRWGYVMWDKHRIDRTGFLSTPFSQFSYPVPGDPPCPTSGRNWAVSWRRRGEIYVEGGRGWWDFDDESKINWPKYSSSPDSLRVKPSSLEAAKKAILAL